MSALPIYLYGADELKKKAKPVTGISNEIIQLIQNMFDTMRAANGIGLAANQVGVLQQVVVVDISEMEEGKGTAPMVLINPEVVHEEGEWEMEEGCLSIPEIREPILRPEKIRLRFRDTNFLLQEVDAEKMLGRVILHEIDHLNGILFTDRLSPGKRVLLKTKLRKIMRGEVETQYPVKIRKKSKLKK